jgi:ElaA protein
MEIFIKTFQELNTEELYTILQLRSEVFVVEQDCVYQDIDGKDSKALHVIGTINKIIVAYTRCFKPGDYFDEASIGRVVVQEGHRGIGLAHQIMKRSVQVIIDRFDTNTIKVSAQTYLKDFYEGHGFFQEGREYLEDGIPHIKMILNRD